MPIDVKICGLSTRKAVDAAVEGGARFVGFVFYAPSPRSLTPAEAASLSAGVPPGVIRVGLVVDASDHFLENLLAEVSLDVLQLHGSELPERVAEIRQRFRLPVMKAIPIVGEDDVVRARSFEPIADWLLFDARPPEGSSRPGGNALAFDWTLLQGLSCQVPWMLAGGLDLRNVAEAVRATGATTVDVSSGVEDAPGVKSPEKIRAFLKVARGVPTPRVEPRPRDGAAGSDAA